MADIRDRYILEVETSKAQKGLSNASLGIANVGASLARLGPLAAAAGAALAGVGAVSYVSNTISEFDDLAKAARNVGAATTEEFEGFQTASKLLGEMGITAAETDRAFRNMTTRLQKAADTGKGPAVDAFNKLGDSILKSNGEVKDFPELFEAVSQALADGTLTVVEAQGALGEMVGPKILGGMQALADQGTTVAEAMKDVKENSNIVSLEAAEQAEVFGDTMGRLQEVAGRLGTEITSALLPVLVELAEGALAVLPGFIDGVKVAFDGMKPALEVLGTLLSEVVIPVFKLLFDTFVTILDVTEPLRELLGTALVNAIKAVGDIIETVIETIRGFVESLGNISEKVSEISSAVGDKFTGMKDSMVQSTKDAYNGVTGWFGQMYDDIVGNSIIPDMADGVLGTFDEMTGGMVSKIADAIPDIVNSFKGIAESISSKFEDITGISLSNIANQVSTLSSDLGARISSLSGSVGRKLSGIVDSARSTVGSLGLGDIFSDASDMFAGLFANGGRIPAGQFGIVGERGAELVSGPATVTPLSGIGTGQNVTYNINAVDARSFRDLLAKDPSLIHALAQKGQSRLAGRVQ